MLATVGVMRTDSPSALCHRTSSEQLDILPAHRASPRPETLQETPPPRALPVYIANHETSAVGHLQRFVVRWTRAAIEQVIAKHGADEVVIKLAR
jgi:hypothetical protein